MSAPAVRAVVAPKLAGRVKVSLVLPHGGHATVDCLASYWRDTLCPALTAGLRWHGVTLEAHTRAERRRDGEARAS